MNIENNILIVQKEERSIKSIENALRFCGYNKITIISSLKKLEVFLNNDFDTVDIIFIDESFLDLQDTKVNGIVLLKTLKSYNDGILILTITNHFFPRICKLAFKLGFMYFINKYPGNEELLMILKNVYALLEEKKKNPAIFEENRKGIVTIYNNIIENKGLSGENEEILLQFEKYKDKRLTPYLLYLLKKSENTLKSKAIYLLGKIKDPIAIQKLASILRDDGEDSQARHAAMVALNEMGQYKLTEPFIDLLKTNDDSGSIQYIQQMEIKAEQITDNIKIEEHDKILFIFFNNEAVTKDYTVFNDYITKKIEEGYVKKFTTININLYFCNDIIPQFFNTFKEIEKNHDYLFYFADKKNQQLDYFFDEAMLQKTFLY